MPLDKLCYQTLSIIGLTSQNRSIVQTRVSTSNLFRPYERLETISVRPSKPSYIVFQTRPLYSQQCIPHGLNLRRLSTLEGLGTSGVEVLAEFNKDLLIKLKFITVYIILVYKVSGGLILEEITLYCSGLMRKVTQSLEK